MVETAGQLASGFHQDRTIPSPSDMVRVKPIPRRSAFMDHQVAYAAGIIDGEGSILLAKVRSSAQFRYPVVSVSSTTPEILEFMKSRWNGTIVKHKTYQDHHKPSCSWRVQGRQALRLIEDVLPMLLEPEKRRRAQMLVERYLDLTPRNGRYSQKMREAKKAFEHEFFHPSTA